MEKVRFDYNMGTEKNQKKQESLTAETDYILPSALDIRVIISINIACLGDTAHFAKYPCDILYTFFCPVLQPYNRRIK